MIEIKVPCDISNNRLFDNSVLWILLQCLRYAE